MISDLTEPLARVIELHQEGRILVSWSAEEASFLGGRMGLANWPLKASRSPHISTELKSRAAQSDTLCVSHQKASLLTLSASCLE